MVAIRPSASSIRKQRETKVEERLPFKVHAATLCGRQRQDRIKDLNSKGTYDQSFNDGEQQAPVFVLSPKSPPDTFCSRRFVECDKATDQQTQTDA